MDLNTSWLFKQIHSLNIKGYLLKNVLYCKITILIKLSIFSDPERPLME